jgi:hypothetical protein
LIQKNQIEPLTGGQFQVTCVIFGAVNGTGSV